MEEGARHAVFIWSAYGATALVALALIVRAIVDHRTQRRALDKLEANGAGPRGHTKQGTRHG